MACASGEAEELNAAVLALGMTRSPRRVLRSTQLLPGIVYHSAPAIIGLNDEQSQLAL